MKNLGVIRVDLMKSSSEIISHSFTNNYQLSMKKVFEKSPTISQICVPGNNKCSHICLPVTMTKYRCSCPSVGGKVLDKKKLNCIDATSILLFASADQGEVGFIDPDNPDERYLISRSFRPVAIAFDQVGKVSIFSIDAK